MAVDIGIWVGQELSEGRYQVTAKLGEGGMGVVYRALDRRLVTEVVVKVPRRAMLDDPAFAGRFAREIHSLVQLSHPHIVKVMDVGEHEGLPFAVMQFLPGGSVRDRQPTGADGQPRPMPLKAYATGWSPSPMHSTLSTAKATSTATSSRIMSFSMPSRTPTSATLVWLRCCPSRTVKRKERL